MTNDRATALREAAFRAALAAPGEWLADMSALELVSAGSGRESPDQRLALCATGEHVFAVLPYLAQARPAAIEDLLAERERLRAALEAIDALEPMELNPSNYDHDIACEVSRNAAHAANIAHNALEGGE